MSKPEHNKAAGSKPFTTIQSLADLHRSIQDCDLPASQKGPIRSAIKRVDALIGHGAMDLPAQPGVLFDRLSAWSPAMANMTPGAFANMKSRLRHALRLADSQLCRPRQRPALTGKWRELQSSLETSSRRTLSRLMYYANSMGWGPEEVCDGLLERFALHLREEAMVANSERVVRSTICAWNALAAVAKAKTLSGLTPPPPKRTPYWIAEDLWPDELRSDVRTVLEQLSKPDLFSGKTVRALKPTTVGQYASMVRTLISAAVGGGIKLENLTGLPAALSPNVVSTALTFLAHRFEGTPRPIMLQMMIRVVVLADILGLPEDDQQELVELLQAVEAKVKPRHKRRTMADKNRKLLDRLENDPRFSDLVLTLPDALAAKARSSPAKQAAPALMRSAVAIELLLTCSMRRENLATLELGKSLKRVGKASSDRWVIELSGESVKNGETLRFVLPQESARLLEEYLEHWRGRLCASPNPWLFPDAKGDQFSSRTLGTMISEHSNKILGVRITPHQFRHISAESFLLEHPDKLQLMSEHLGHRDTNTTRNYYARSKQKQASREYQEHVLKVRGAAAKRLKPRQKRLRTAGEDFL